jgi:Sec-independent protein secretion pathway component TatC
MLVIPLIVLYEVSIWVTQFVRKKKEQAKAEAA